MGPDIYESVLAKRLLVNISHDVEEVMRCDSGDRPEGEEHPI